MARKTNLDFSSTSWNFLTKELETLYNEMNVNKEEALTEAAEYLADKLERATPTRTGKTKESWNAVLKYKGVRYVNNEALNNQGVPIINVLEYSSKGKPFVRKTFDSCIPKFERIFNKNLEKGE